MSYILDALKKSDQERKRGDVPGLQTVHIPMAAEQEKPWFLYGLLALLLLILAFVIVLMMSTKPVEQINEAFVSDEIVAQQDLRSNFQSNNEAFESTKIQKIKPQTVTSRQQRLTKPQFNDDVLAVKEHAVTASQSVSAELAEDLSDVPYLHELAGYQQQAIPDMQFAGHVYSSSASNRSIIINNNAMSEGDNIMLGLKVERITSSGVVFRYQDLLFKMDILQDWSFE